MRASRVVLGLLAGLTLGLVLGYYGVGPAAANWIEPVGTLWVNALRMTVIPLIVSLLMVGIADASDIRRIGGMGLRSVMLFLVMLTSVAVIIALAGPLMYAWLSIDPAGVALLRESAAPVNAASAHVSARDFITGLVPTNPIKAAADGAMLPLLVFTVLFATATARAGEQSRAALTEFFRAVRDVTFVLIGWILAVAPIGVFALGVVATARIGLGAVGAIGYYIALVIVLHIVFGAALYALAVIGGRVPLRLFAKSVAPAQVVALSSRSSLASLPALVQGAERVLKLPAEVTGFVLPFAVSTFKLTSPINWTLGALLVSRLYGIDIGVSGIVTIAAGSVLLNAATPGIPSGGLLVQAPLYQAVGLPIEGIGLLIAVDAIPDMFKTAFNVTADMVVAVLITRWNSR